MKSTVLILVRVGACLWFGFLVYCVFFYDGARESWKKHRLGDRYEGPLDD